MRFNFVKWFELWEVDDEGVRTGLNYEFNKHIGNDDFMDMDVNISKSMTSNNDSASVMIHNHPILEELYNDAYLRLKEFHKKHFEVDILLAYRQGQWDVDKANAHCIYSGDLDDMSVSGDNSVTDQSLSLQSTAGGRAATRTVVNKVYSAGMTYKAVVIDVISHFKGYRLKTLDDPLGKLNKTLKRTRSYHRQASEILNDISRDLDMTWGFDCNPWNLATRELDGGVSGYAQKHIYFVDKVSVFDVTGIHDLNTDQLDGNTGKLGRIGYTKSQFTFNHLFEHRLNIGMPVNVYDGGTMYSEANFNGRINRVQINNENMNIECHYINPLTGLAIIEKDKKHGGALVL